MAANEAARGAIEREIFLRSLMVATPQGSALEQLARSMVDTSFEAGEVIYRAGEPAALLYFMTSGAVDLALDGLDPWHLEAPAVIGMLDVLHSRAHARTAIATAPSRALILRGEDWFDVLEENFELARDAIIRACETLHELHLSSPGAGGFPAFDAPGASSALDARSPAHGLNLLERTLALRSVGAFAKVGVQVLAILAHFAAERVLSPGEVLFREGERAASFFVVVSGVARITRADPEILARMGPGAIVGGTCAIGLSQRAYTAEAESPVVLLELGRDALFDLLEDYVEMTRTLMAALGGERERVLEARAAEGASVDLAGPPDFTRRA